jgi:beta-phosphoglucomutase-like phosphatase (HAD superfamily)
MPSPSEPTGRTAFLFDLDGTLVDSVYQHVLAWREALEKAGMELSVWRIHRRIGMSGGLLLNSRSAARRPRRCLAGPRRRPLQSVSSQSQRHIDPRQVTQ